jgi:hypothetical protein
MGEVVQFRRVRRARTHQAELAAVNDAAVTMMREGTAMVFGALAFGAAVSALMLRMWVEPLA